MAQKIKDIEGYFAKLSKAYDEIKADMSLPGLLDELDGDRRILAHAVFYIVSRQMVKKLDGMGPFELLRLIEERMLRVFITDPNSERVDQLLDKADLLYELLPYMVAQCISDNSGDEDYAFPEDALYDTHGLLVAAPSYAIGVEDNMLDPVFDSLSLRTGKVGSPVIEADAAEIMEQAKLISDEIEYDTEDLDEDEAPTITEMRELDVDRQMLVIGLMSINMDAFVDQLDCPEMSILREDIEAAISSYNGGGVTEDTTDCIDDVIESIKDVITYIMNEDRPDDNATNITSSMFSGMLTVYIRDAHKLSEKDFAKVWTKVHPDGKFNTEALIDYSRKIVDRDLPGIIRDFVNSQE